MPNDIHEAIGHINGEVRVITYRDETTLLDLWKLGERTDDNRPLVVIDDDRRSPLQPDRMGAYLSALDWALLHCCRRADNSVAPVIVLDLRTRLDHKVSDTDRSHLPSTVHYFAPSRRGLYELERFITCLQDVSAVAKPSAEATANFRTRWLAGLAMSDTRAGHHEMNNSLAPLVLALGNDKLEAKVAPPVSGPHPLADPAFTRQVMLRALSWAAEGTKPGGLKALGWTPPKGCGEVRLLLLDDQAEEGWIPILANLFGLDLVMDGREAGPFKERACGPRSSLWVASDAEAVLDRVWPNGGPWRSDKLLRFTGEAKGGPYTEVLLLDLRLFAQALNREAEFLEAVSKAHKAVTGLTPAWASDVRNSGFGQSPSYLAALCGFARLITEIDFTFPVVVWSSTGQRKITEALKNCRNVVTGLEKPRFDAYSPSPRDLQSGFRVAASAALKRVNELMLARVLSRQLFMERKVVQIPEGMNHVEIYFDESRTPDNPAFRLGALIVFYESAAAADRLHGELAAPFFDRVEFTREQWQNEDSFPGRSSKPQESWSTGLVFTGDKRLPKKLAFGSGSATHAGTPYTDSTAIRTLVANELAKRMKGKACALWLRFSSSRPVGNYGIDGRYPTILAETLKTIFTYFVRGEDRYASIYIATKKATAASEGVARDLFSKFGLLSELSEEGNWKYDSMTNHSACYPVIDAHQFSLGREGACELRSARGVTLSYKPSPPRPAHYEWQLLYGLFRDVNRADDALGTARPMAMAPVQRAWRHMHYFADELLEKGAARIYGDAGVLLHKGSLSCDLYPAHAQAPSTLADAGRALLWQNYEEAAVLFYEEVLESWWRNDESLNEFETFVASKFSEAARERAAAEQMWLSVLGCVASSIAHERGDVMVYPFDSKAEHDVAIQQEVMRHIQERGWGGRFHVEGRTLTFFEARDHLQTISEKLPPSMRAQ